jgi:HAMP domain-containing protein
MDNALLTQLAYPETRLSLWWGDRAFASSEGNQGLDALALPGTRPPALAMPWPGESVTPAPSLLIESTSAPLLTPLDMALPMVVGFIALMISLWFTLGTWGRHILARLRALERAAEGFLARRTLDDEIRRDLNAENSREHDEIAELAGSLERLMQAAGEAQAPARRHEPD